MFKILEWGKKQNHYQVLHVRISLGFKVQPQQF